MPSVALILAGGGPQEQFLSLSEVLRAQPTSLRRGAVEKFGMTAPRALRNSRSGSLDAGPPRLCIRDRLVVMGIACLLLAVPLCGPLWPVAAQAQSTGTKEAERTTGKDRSKKSKQLRTAPQGMAAAWNGNLQSNPTPVYSPDLLADQVWSARWELAVVGGALVAVGLRDWHWGGSKFAFIHEGWFGSDPRHGGMDKIGHSFSTYLIADILTDRIRANTSDPIGAQITGALLAFGIMGAGETIDGFTGRHRFSREDIAANAIGAAFSVFRNSIPGLREKLDFRFMHTPASYERPGITPSDFHLIPPYERQRYILALKGSGFEALKDTPLRYLELQGGFDARGFEDKERQLGYPIERSFYVGIGLNLNEILFGAGSLPNLANYKDTIPGLVAQKTFEYIEVPYTAVYSESTVSTIRVRPETWRSR